jgi:hypothetical protein
MMDGAPGWGALSGDVKAARTEGHLFTNQPGYRKGQASWATDFDDAFQSVGIQDG